jgi:hypothetical protein
VQIISASRRTDIPAFYSEWFMNRIRAGFAEYKNPFGGQRHRVSLSPEEVSCIVFWSRDYRPLLSHLDELERRGFAFVFHFTITGLPAAFDAFNPPTETAIETCRELAARYGAQRALWRYDPVVFSDQTDALYHAKRFRELASRLEGTTERCYFSFLDFYTKIEHNLEKVERETGLRCFDPQEAEKKDLASALAQAGGDHGISLYACCEDFAVGGAVHKGHCVDAELIRALFPERAASVPIKPTRPGCGCYESRDIGAYDTCGHGCVYCYANSDRNTAKKNAETHDPASASLG